MSHRRTLWGVRGIIIPILGGAARFRSRLSDRQVRMPIDEAHERHVRGQEVETFGDGHSEQQPIERVGRRDADDRGGQHVRVGCRRDRCGAS